MNAFSRHTFLALGFGVIVGYHLRKYRREIIDAAGGKHASDQAEFGVLGDMLSGIRKGSHAATQRWNKRNE